MSICKDNEGFLKKAREVFKIEAEGILGLVELIDEQFSQVIKIIDQTKGRVVVSGIGKSGLIGRKISATLNSTGTPSVFLHPVEALHGDLGIIQKNDLLLALSYSGETKELLQLVYLIPADLKVPIIAITGNSQSKLALASNHHLAVTVKREACSLGLAPTASTTATLAMGDALAVVLLNLKDFARSDFRRLHPGGSLGERLNKFNRDLMRPFDSLPSCSPDISFKEALILMNKSQLGVILALKNNCLKGIFTDGDLRRLVVENRDLSSAKLDDVMIKNPKTVAPNQLIAETLEKMQKSEITVLPVVDEQNMLLGLLHLHDLLGKENFTI